MLTMKNTLSITSRIILVFAAIGSVIVLFTPIWRIELNAPQYPEGLGLTIHADGLKGNVDIINGLNHYIGMKTLHNEDFIEFSILPYLFMFFVAAFLLVALLNRKKWLNLLFILFVTFGITAVVDFWRWEYNYGHNLDPNAAIIVPGMAYQPPLIGFKQLLNFGAYSIPDTGGWIFIGVGVMLLITVLIEWKRHRRSLSNVKNVQLLLLLAASLSLASCKTGPEPIVTGKDNCYFCKMTISDIKYGAEIITRKGRVYKFDDIHCVLSFLKMSSTDSDNEIYLVDYAGDHSLMQVKHCYLAQGNDIHGPMDGNVIAFKSRDSMLQVAARFNATPVEWHQLIK